MTIDKAIEVFTLQFAWLDHGGYIPYGKLNDNIQMEAISYILPLLEELKNEGNGLGDK